LCSQQDESHKKGRALCKKSRPLHHMIAWGVKAFSSLLGFGARNAFHNQLLGFFGIAPSDHFHPFAGFEIFVALEKCWI